MNSEEFYTEMKSFVELRSRSDVPVGVCLSSVLDSSTKVSLIINEVGEGILILSQWIHPEYWIKE